MNRHHRKLARKMGWICGLLAVGAISLAKPAVVITQSGQRYEGDVTEKANDVIINIRGVETRISRDEIAAIEYSKSFEDEFNDRLAKLTEGDAVGRIELARWAMQQEQYTKARDALELALQADPNSAEATQMLVLCAQPDAGFKRIEEHHAAGRQRRRDRPEARGSERDSAQPAS